MSTFGRLNYTFDSTKFGDGINLTDGQKLTLNYPSPLYTWQASDLAGSSVGNYFKNPHSANLTLMTTYTNQLLTYSNTIAVTYNTAPTEANTLNALANTLLIEITSFTDHTNRMSGVTESSNKLTTPDYQIAMSVGRQVLSITNQVDGVQNNAPILGNFTSLAIVSDVSNSVIQLVSSAATLNASLIVVGGNTFSNISQASMNTIIANVQTAYNLLNSRRVGDTTFYTNSLALVQDYQTVSQFSNLGVNSSYLIKDVGIGTTKLQNNLLYSTPVGYPNNTYTSTQPSTTTTTTSPENLTVTGVVPGTYTFANISLDAYGRVLYATSGAYYSAGNVGIGTSSPQKKLVVSNEGAAGVELDPFTRSATTGGSLLAYNRSGAAFVRMDYDASEHLFFTSGSERVRITSGGNVVPGTNGTQNLGSAALRWANVYTSDLHLNNGVGNYTIVEGEEDLFLYNNKNGKTYKFALIEVDSNTVPPKMEK